MSAAASNRGSRAVVRDLDQRMGPIRQRAERQAQKDEVARLSAQIVKLERDLARARRCIAELRRSKEERALDARVALAAADSAIKMLTRIAFPKDHS